MLSLARNRITRLPPYFAEFRSLETLGIDHNLVDWPPRAILEPFVDANDKEAMRDWIRMLQAWVEQHALITDGRKYSDDSTLNETQDWEFAGCATSLPDCISPRF